MSTKKPAPLRSYKILLNSRGKALRCEMQNADVRGYFVPIRSIDRKGRETYLLCAANRKIALVMAYREWMYHQAVQQCPN